MKYFCFSNIGQIHGLQLTLAANAFSNLSFLFVDNGVNILVRLGKMIHWFLAKMDLCYLQFLIHSLWVELKHTANPFPLLKPGFPCADILTFPLQGSCVHCRDFFFIPPVLPRVIRTPSDVYRAVLRGEVKWAIIAWNVLSRP